MNTTKQLADLLNSWCDQETKRCNEGLQSMNENPELNKQNILLMQTEVSMYQSFRNRIKSILDETGIGCQHQFMGSGTNVNDWTCIYCKKSQSELNPKTF